MTLSELLSPFTCYKMGTVPQRNVTGLFIDHRQVEADSVFVAIRGHSVDGHQFLPEAIKAGAIALVVEEASQIPTDYTGAVVTVPDTRKALSEMAGRFYAYPTRKLFCVGITGTNGKTSVSLMVEHILRDFQWPTGVLGTIDHHLNQHVWKSQLTTPDSITLNRRLSEFVALGAKAAVFEVSSHAISQNRTDGIEFDVVVFTNLSRDHLDYHGDMENYFQVKEKLFSQIPWNTEKNCTAIINRSDSWGCRIRVAEKCRLMTYGEVKSDLQFQILSVGFDGSRFRIQLANKEIEAWLPMPGSHNVYNAVAAIGVGVAAGRGIGSCVESLSHFLGVPGRLQSVPNRQGLHVFIDYAHTDAALRAVLETLSEIRERSQSRARILTVFGCGGDRDKGKRPLMTEAALALSDAVMITSDNPRSEDPMGIIKDTVSGFESEIAKKKLEIEVDRREAIRKAIHKAGVGDVVLIAGKGHEDYQIIGQRRLNFSDVEVAQQILESL